MFDMFTNIVHCHDVSSTKPQGSGLRWGTEYVKIKKKCDFTTSRTVSIFAVQPYYSSRTKNLFKSTEYISMDEMKSDIHCLCFV